MPANTLPDPSVMFLYLCMINSDYTKINFEAVGAATGLKVPAARMRWTRLKKNIESGMVDGKMRVGKSGDDGNAGGDSEDGDADADADIDVDADATASGTPSPQKKRRVTKPRAKAGEKKARGKGKKKGAELERSDEVKNLGDDEDEMLVKQEGMDYEGYA
ncbi:hypothetical protein BJX61DRAFT_541520 [Aspergillus egyptiacus]|nr:hypothetical protein BJX61DRAFT_541520 [Aspergillus egyptiacus]